MPTIHFLSLNKNTQLVVDSYDEDYLEQLCQVSLGLDSGRSSHDETDEGYESGGDVILEEIEAKLRDLNLAVETPSPISFDRRQRHELLAILTQLHRAGQIHNDPFILNGTLLSVQDHPVILNFDTMRKGSGGEMIMERFELLEAILPSIPEGEFSSKSARKAVLIGPTPKSLEDLDLERFLASEILSSIQQQFSTANEDNRYYVYFTNREDTVLEKFMDKFSHSFPDIKLEHLDGLVEYPIVIPLADQPFETDESIPASELYSQFAKIVSARWKKQCSLPPPRNIRRIAGHSSKDKGKEWLVLSYWTSQDCATLRAMTKLGFNADYAYSMLGIDSRIQWDL